MTVDGRPTNYINIINVRRLALPFFLRHSGNQWWSKLHNDQVHRSVEYRARLFGLVEYVSVRTQLGHLYLIVRFTHIVGRGKG